MGNDGRRVEEGVGVTAHDVVDPAHLLRPVEISGLPATAVVAEVGERHDELRALPKFSLFAAMSF